MTDEYTKMVFILHFYLHLLIGTWRFFLKQKMYSSHNVLIFFFIYDSKISWLFLANNNIVVQIVTFSLGEKCCYVKCYGFLAWNLNNFSIFFTKLMSIISRKLWTYGFYSFFFLLFLPIFVGAGKGRGCVLFWYFRFLAWYLDKV